MLDLSYKMQIDFPQKGFTTVDMKCDGMKTIKSHYTNDWNPLYQTLDTLKIGFAISVTFEIIFQFQFEYLYFFHSFNGKSHKSAVILLQQFCELFYIILCLYSMNCIK